MDTAPAPGAGSALLASRLATFVIVAAAGAGLNLLPFSLGWGLDLVFGQSIVMAATRLLDRRLLILAGALASLPTLLLWHHPAAVVIWTAEVATVACLQRRLPPIAADALFWLVLGTPLTLASYGWLLGTSGVALPLVVVKQAVNGLLDVAIGELLYHAFYATRRRHAQELPKLSLETFVLTSFAVASILPVLAFTRLAAPEKEADVRRLATARADAALAIAAQTLAELPARRENQADADQPATPDLSGLPARFAAAAAPLRDIGQVYLVLPDRRIEPLDDGAVAAVAPMRKAMLDPEAEGFLTPTAFGTSRMTSLSASVYLKSAPAPAGYGHLAVLVPVSRQIEAIRVYQLQLFGLLAIMIMAIIALTTVSRARSRSRSAACSRPQWACRWPATMIRPPRTRMNTSPSSMNWPATLPAPAKSPPTSASACGLRNGACAASPAMPRWRSTPSISTGRAASRSCSSVAASNGCSATRRARSPG